MLHFKQVMMVGSALAVTAALNPLYASENQLPPPLVGSPYVMDRVGVHTQIQNTRINQTDLSNLAAAGFSYVRQGLYWNVVEKQKGVYDYTEFDDFVRSTKRRGLKLLVILAYSNPVYTGEVAMPTKQDPNRKLAPAPTTDEQRKAFAAFAANTVERYKNEDGIVWEIWNEPDVSHFWVPKDNVDDYIKLAATACGAIREKVPQAMVIGPALGAGALPNNGGRERWMNALVNSGPLMSCLSGLSVHPHGFAQEAPKSIHLSYPRIREMMRQSTPGIVLPVVSSEWGYTNFGDGKDAKNTPHKLQAAYFVRLMLANVAEGSPLSIWYNWKDTGDNPKDSEQGFGMVTRQGKKKPVYEAMQVMKRELAGYKLVGPEEGLPAGVFGYRLLNDAGESKLVLWRAGEDAADTQTTSKIFKNATVTSLLGKSVETSWGWNENSIMLGAEPVYITPGR